MSTLSVICFDDATLSGARLVWELLQGNCVHIVTENPDLGAVRQRLDDILDEFEHGLQRSLPRPETVRRSDRVRRTPNGQNSTETVDHSTLFQKLERIETRLAESTETATPRNRLSETLRKQIAERLDALKNDGLFDVVLNVTGYNGGRFGREGKDGTIRINTNTLHEILEAKNVAVAARSALRRGAWLLTTEHSPDESVAKVIEFFEKIVAGAR